MSGVQIDLGDGVSRRLVMNLNVGRKVKELIGSDPFMDGFFSE